MPVRPRKSREEMKDLVLGSARRLFAERGYDGTTVQAIADDLGISKQALMHHFPSKAGIRDSILADCRQRAIEVLPPLIVALSSDRNALESALDKVIGFLEETPGIARFLLRELLSREPPPLDGVPLALIVSVREHVRQGIADGVFREDIDVDLVIFTLGSLLLVTFATLDQPPPPDLSGLPFEAWEKRRIREMVRIVRASLLAQPAGGWRD